MTLNGSLRESDSYSGRLNLIRAQPNQIHEFRPETVPKVAG